MTFHERHLLLLLRRHVPAVAAGRVKVRGLARHAGRGSLIALEASEPGCDAIHACIGPRARHLRDLVESLDGEPVHLMRWLANPAALLRGALAPSVVQALSWDHASRRVHLRTSFLGREARQHLWAELVGRMCGYEVVLKFGELA